MGATIVSCQAGSGEILMDDFLNELFFFNGSGSAVRDVLWKRHYRLIKLSILPAMPVRRPNVHHGTACSVAKALHVQTISTTNLSSEGNCG